MGWKILKDHTEKIDSADSAVGKERGYKGKDAYFVRAYDDDGELYYEAACDGEGSAEYFHDWAMHYAGCTATKIRKSGERKWGWFIS